jgi:hypothetical protein
VDKGQNREHLTQDIPHLGIAKNLAGGNFVAQVLPVDVLLHQVEVVPFSKGSNQLRNVGMLAQPIQHLGFSLKEF